MFIILVLLTIVPYISGVYDIIYLIIVVAGVHLVLMAVMIRCWKDPRPVTLGKMSNILKADMLIGLLAIYAGS